MIIHTGIRELVETTLALDQLIEAVHQVDAEQDRARGFTVTDSGITVVGKGTVIAP